MPATCRSKSPGQHNSTALFIVQWISKSSRQTTSRSTHKGDLKGAKCLVGVLMSWQGQTIACSDRELLGRDKAALKVARGERRNQCRNSFVLSARCWLEPRPNSLWCQCSLIIISVAVRILCLHEVRIKLFNSTLDGSSKKTSG